MNLGYAPIIDPMPVKRFEMIKGYSHFTDSEAAGKQCVLGGPHQPKTIPGL